MNEANKPNVEALTARIRSESESLGVVRNIEIVPHAVEGHFICRIELEPQTKPQPFKKHFKATAVGNSVYFTEPASKAA
jgi:hypothetical protein